MTTFFAGLTLMVTVTICVYVTTGRRILRSNPVQRRGLGLWTLMGLGTLILYSARAAAQPAPPAGDALLTLAALAVLLWYVGTALVLVTNGVRLWKLHRRSRRDAEVLQRLEQDMRGTW